MDAAQSIHFSYPIPRKPKSFSEKLCIFLNKALVFLVYMNIQI